MKVVIIGLGGLGEGLATTLLQEEDHELVLVDVLEERCTSMSEKTDALVLHGDGSNPEILLKARLREADALVACTGVDAINTVIAMLGKEFGVPRIVVKLDSAALVAACNQIGVNQIVMPQIAAAAKIRDALYGRNRMDLSSLALGGMRLAELAVSRDLGRLRNGPFPSGALVLSVRRGNEVLFPRPDITLRAGDTLVLLLEGSRSLESVRKAIGEE